MADSKKTVVIASVLKPVDDSRLHEKIAVTLARSGEYHVHMIGVESARINDPDIEQHPHTPFRRISLRRMLMPWKIFFTTLRLKPDLFIIATHELLNVAMILKLLTGCRVVYDVQENYYWNILYTPAFPLVLKPFVALYVRGKELLTSRYVDHFFLAEKGYEQELKFPGNRYTVLENKVSIAREERKEHSNVRSKSTIHLLFSGTLAETTGVFTAIDLAIKLHVIDDRFRLTIIGYGAQSAVVDKVRLLMKPRPFIRLIAREGPVPHAEIFKRIKQADFGLITYKVNPSTMNTTPTKLYEYLGFRLPIILVNHRPWAEICQPYNAAVVFDPGQYDAASIYREMMDKSFYTSDPTNVYWDSEAPALLSVIAKVTSRRRRPAVASARQDREDTKVEL